MSELKPCYKCGRQPRSYVHDRSNSENYFESFVIACKCGIHESSSNFWTWTQGYGNKRDADGPTAKAIEDWNNRPAEDALRSKLAVAVEALEKITHCQWSEDDSFVRIAHEALRKIRP